jgi:FkbM family methyltransferase
MSTKNSRFLRIAKKYPVFKNIYFFYNIYIRNFQFLFNGSQFGEEKKLLKLFNRNQKGFYVDLGCFHPTRSNNTFKFYKRGWKGLNIDLNPLSIDLFNFARPKDINVCAAISNKKSKKKLYFLGDLDSKNTLDLNHKNWLGEHFNLNKSDFKIKYIKTSTLGQILKKNKIYKIDLLNIDIEGHEYEVIKSFDFKKFNINVICIELLNFNKLSANRKKQLVLLLKKNKFKLVDKSKINFIFKRIN